MTTQNEVRLLLGDERVSNRISPPEDLCLPPQFTNVMTSERLSRGHMGDVDCPDGPLRSLVHDGRVLSLTDLSCDRLENVAIRMFAVSGAGLFNQSNLFVLIDYNTQ